MVESILTVLGTFVMWLFKVLGAWGGGVVFAMAIESACIPLPSELIMPYAGFLAVQGTANTLYVFGSEQFSVFWLGMLGAIGCLLGSWLAYFVGVYGGRPFLVKYGKYILFSHHDLDIADRFFKKYGDIAIFTSRLMPVVRTFISLPAGISKMNFWKFSIYSLLGSIPWCWALAWVGWKIGKNATDLITWKETLKLKLGHWLHLVDALILVALIAAVVWYIMRHVKHSRIDAAASHKEAKPSAKKKNKKGK